MADSYSIFDGQVVPYSGGRMNTDTDSWRDATDLEMEQQEYIARLEAENETMKDAIRSVSEELRAASATRTLHDKLVELSDLYKQDVLTEWEYGAAKEKVLGL